MRTTCKGMTVDRKSNERGMNDPFQSPFLLCRSGRFFVSQEVHPTKIHPINYIMRRPKWKIDLD